MKIKVLIVLFLWLLSVFVMVWSGIDWYYTFNPSECPVGYSPVIKWPFSPAFCVTGIIFFYITPSLMEHLEKE